jgi:hypothetical protein
MYTRHFVWKTLVCIYDRFSVFDQLFYTWVTPHEWGKFHKNAILPIFCKCKKTGNFSQKKLVKYTIIMKFTHHFW